MRFTLSSCFATHSESVAVAAVLVVDCPNLNRPHAFIPTLHPSSITLAALILFALSSHPQSLLFLPISLQYIYSAAKVFNTIEILPYKFRKTYCRIYLVISSVTVKRKERKHSPGTGSGQVLLAGVGWGFWRNYFLDSGFFWRYKKSRMDVFLLASSFFKVDDAVVVGCLGVVVVVVMRKKGRDIIGRVW